ncbi:phosphatidylserine decarboxylase [Campylobacter concisus]|uniref:phosphatidylserine decarboxylase n=1 Tax=Campylobacter concisus TaxID=199 RepID=UPI00188381A1|nr:phosphatidylserine decarboxylase [Campylobacter concisus]MBE9851820.1 phosphatidylserine decarboxylase [Campylobacter concisus]
MSGYITKAGYKYILFFLILLVISVLFGFVPLFFLALLLLTLYFFRDPEREPFTDDKLALLSPIDGKIKEISVSNFDDKEVAKIVISKPFFGVGTLRVVSDARVVDIKRRHGLFLCQAMKISEMLNERAIIRFEKGNIKFAMKIIAGVFSRSLEIYNIASLKASRKFGFLGSGEVILYLPRDTKICVSVGESVKAASLLGYFEEEK